MNEEHVVEMVASLLGLRRFPEAIEETQKFTRRFPNNPDSYFTRARIEAFLQKDAEPLRAALRDHGNLLDEAGRKAIGAEIATAEGRYLDAVKLWAEVPSDDPRARAERTGFLYLAAGNGGRAEQSFREAERIGLDLLKRDPGRVDLPDIAIVQSMLGKHAAALATIEMARMRWPESRDAINGPVVSFARSFILVRAGRSAEGYAEVTRLLRVPFGAPYFFFFAPHPVLLLLKNDPHYDELLNHPPRL